MTQWKKVLVLVVKLRKANSGCAVKTTNGVAYFSVYTTAKRLAIVINEVRNWYKSTKCLNENITSLNGMAI